jgi:hypothetical protein
LERKTENALGDDQFGFRRGKGTRDALGILRIISEQTLDIDEELCAFFIDWQKAFDHVNWTKLMQIVKGIGIDWRERRLMSRLYMDQSVKIRLDQEETRSVKIGEELDKVAVCPRFCSTYTAITLPRKLLKGLETSNRRTSNSRCEICR